MTKPTFETTFERRPNDSQSRFPLLPPRSGCLTCHNALNDEAQYVRATTRSTEPLRTPGVLYTYYCVDCGSIAEQKRAKQLEPR